ncbi:flagellar assembly protein FliH [Alkalispirochaeta alkalica]|uniref:flagellar assembly protein FliH n=1 Tax=Alkalispirochaeta alkalica TaxID=46356 RepID=UPI00035EF1BC|nr:flagellar assembly protein FliH [Alkalispirochaeta alkalica]
MGKNVFRSGEVQYKPHKVFLQPPRPVIPHHRTPLPVETLDEVDEVESVEDYTGPSADDLRREAEAFKEQWEQEREEMISSARAEAEEILHKAEEEAFRQIRDKTEQAAEERRRASEEADATRAAAQAEAERIIAEAESRSQTIEAEAARRGHQEGREAGIQEGLGELQRVIDRFHLVLSKAIERRNEIIQESESQVVALVLSIAKKVIKVISEHQKNVVINNISQSLQKLQQKSDILVRVNLADLPLVTSHREEILRMAERVKHVTIAEDTSVDPGGCIIETDFGEIDARISSQLREIEDRILEMVPIKNRPKRPGGSG